MKTNLKIIIYGSGLENELKALRMLIISLESLNSEIIGQVIDPDTQEELGKWEYEYSY